MILDELMLKISYNASISRACDGSIYIVAVLLLRDLHYMIYQFVGHKNFSEQ